MSDVVPGMKRDMTGLKPNKQINQDTMELESPPTSPGPLLKAAIATKTPEFKMTSDTRLVHKIRKQAYELCQVYALLHQYESKMDSLEASKSHIKGKRTTQKGQGDEQNEINKERILYIETLEHALNLKAEELNIHGHAELLAVLAELQQELVRKDQIIESQRELNEERRSNKASVATQTLIIDAETKKQNVVNCPPGERSDTSFVEYIQELKQEMKQQQQQLQLKDQKLLQSKTKIDQLQNELERLEQQKTHLEFQLQSMDAVQSDLVQQFHQQMQEKSQAQARAPDHESSVRPATLQSPVALVPTTTQEMTSASDLDLLTLSKLEEVDPIQREEFPSGLRKEEQISVSKLQQETNLLQRSFGINVKTESTPQSTQTDPVQEEQPHQSISSETTSSIQNTRIQQHQVSTEVQKERKVPTEEKVYPRIYPSERTESRVSGISRFSLRDHQQEITLTQQEQLEELLKENKKLQAQVALFRSESCAKELDYQRRSRMEHKLLLACNALTTEEPSFPTFKRPTGSSASSRTGLQSKIQALHELYQLLQLPFHHHEAKAGPYGGSPSISSAPTTTTPVTKNHFTGAIRSST